MAQTDRQTGRQTDGRTWQLLDQLGPEGRVGENRKQSKKKRKKSRKSFKLVKKLSKNVKIYFFSPEKREILYSLNFANPQD